MDLEAERAKRDARIKAKHERIRTESGPVGPAPEDGAAPDVKSEVPKPETKEAKRRSASVKKSESMGAALSGNPKGKEQE